MSASGRSPALIPQHGSAQGCLMSTPGAVLGRIVQRMARGAGR